MARGGRVVERRGRGWREEVVGGIMAAKERRERGK